MTLVNWILAIIAGTGFSLFLFAIYITMRRREDEIEILSRNSERPSPTERDK
jgi:hypothetical protein